MRADEGVCSTYFGWVAEASDILRFIYLSRQVIAPTVKWGHKGWGQE